MAGGWDVLGQEAETCFVLPMSRFHRRVLQRIWAPLWSARKAGRSSWRSARHVLNDPQLASARNRLSGIGAGRPHRDAEGEAWLRCGKLRAQVEEVKLAPEL
jgi:hypothetical protein